MSVTIRHHSLQSKSVNQQGAVAIEFALLFVLFFAIFHALVSYAIVFFLQAAFLHAAEEGARAAIAVDRAAYANNASYLNDGVLPRVRTTVGEVLDWLPDNTKLKVLGAGNSLVQVTLVDNQLTVNVIYTDYRNDPLVPILFLPIVGQVPLVPDDLSGTAVTSL